ncbi:hypothetical protein M427DRAFT_115476 [Gonapodya prolifera JEL478]|uniref:Ribosomal protein L28 n=1 Tax=Gonapodya prolifera (strain JEL478) TaxID=1344416 RepID=A0A139A2B8_GONPJ|nr:hypothetical protein M427DRAFT_115476 [Gonapodya prolifera JEL478]|eukprot:KXS10884.1 hypothetical protein M427DRAFT_115476 [Gonapodya prolifera JEL478]
MASSARAGSLAFLQRTLGHWPELFRGHPKHLPNLFHGARTGSGSKISEMGNKSKRTFRPNVTVKTLYSGLLNSQIKFRVSMRALRTIDKKGGLDVYLLTTPDKLIIDPLALEVKAKVVERYNKQAKIWDIENAPPAPPTPAAPAAPATPAASARRPGGRAVPAQKDSS